MFRKGKGLLYVQKEEGYVARVSLPAPHYHSHASSLTHNKYLQIRTPRNVVPYIKSRI